MKRKNKEKIIYYNDLKNDDFSGTNIKIKPLKDSYKYLHKNPLWQIACFNSFLLANFWWQHNLVTKKNIGFAMIK